MDEEYLLELLAAAKSQTEYDKLVDRYIFGIDKKHRNTKHKREQSHNMLTTFQMQQILRMEKSYDFTKPWL